MAKVIDLTGRIFGKLTVLNKSTERGKKNQIKWDCKCECGNYHTVTGESLRHSKSRSCGCLQWEPTNKIKDRKKAILKVQYYQIIKRHRKKFVSDIISLDTFIELVCSNCYYCDAEFSTELEDRTAWTKSKGLVSSTKVQINGIDRINSDIGYTDGNCVPCCKHCNFAKNSLTQMEFKSWISKVYKCYVLNPEKEMVQLELQPKN